MNSSDDLIVQIYSESAGTSGMEMEIVYGDAPELEVEYTSPPKIKRKKNGEPLLHEYIPKVKNASKKDLIRRIKFLEENTDTAKLERALRDERKLYNSLLLHVSKIEKDLADQQDRAESQQTEIQGKDLLIGTQSKVVDRTFALLLKYGQHEKDCAIKRLTKKGRVVDDCFCTCGWHEVKVML